MLVLMESRRPLDTDRGIYANYYRADHLGCKAHRASGSGFPTLGNVDAELPLRPLAVNLLFLPIAPRYARQRQAMQSNEARCRRPIWPFAARCTAIDLPLTV